MPTQTKVRLSDELAEAIAAIADQTGLAQSEVIRWAILRLTQLKRLPPVPEEIRSKPGNPNLKNPKLAKQQGIDAAKQRWRGE